MTQAAHMDLAAWTRSRKTTCERQRTPYNGPRGRQNTVDSECHRQDSIRPFVGILVGKQVSRQTNKQ